MRRYFTTFLLGHWLLAAPLHATTLKELQADSKLTPKRYASLFTDFAYKFTQEVQDPDVFLKTKSGDCDDYAILADTVLKPKGFGTRLISIRMPGLDAHVVCYVNEEKGYLDYNNRIYLIKIEHSGTNLRDIADKVAKSFAANWTSVSEFTYLGDSMKQLVTTVAKTDQGVSATTPPPEQKSAPKIKIDF